VVLNQFAALLTDFRELNQHEGYNMPVTFGREIVNRDVHDSADDKLGNVADFRIDIGSGQITNILVMIEPDINPQLLPWPTVNGLLSVPVEEIESVGKVIKLSE
jgi:sporulation protein YlmC with PRC-barrel domain